MTAIVGIDIAKDKFDVCVLASTGQAQQTTFPNTKSGINKLHGWLKQRGAQTEHVCMEATGIYGDLVAETLHTRGLHRQCGEPGTYQCLCCQPNAA